jgi:hypothetical protein
MFLMTLVRVCVNTVNPGVDINRFWMEISVNSVESTYGEMVLFSNADYANHLNANAPALDFA